MTDEHDWLGSFGARVKIADLVCFDDATLIPIGCIVAVKSRLALRTGRASRTRGTFWAWGLLEPIKRGIDGIVYLGPKQISHCSHLRICKGSSIAIPALSQVLV